MNHAGWSKSTGEATGIDRPAGGQANLAIAIEPALQ
jgi:hypothetical protein